MRCEYKNDNLKVNYSGSLHITNGGKVDIYLHKDEIPTYIREELHLAELHDSCYEMRHIAQELTDILNNDIPKKVL